ncbi:MAG: Tn3 family transposase [Streptosporangiaceae bacterium]
MTDRQLLQAVRQAGAELLNGLGPIIQQSFAHYGSAGEMGDPRFPHAMPVKVPGQVLMMVTEANDAFGLSLLGLSKHATAAALGSIRVVTETLAWARWLQGSRRTRYVTGSPRPPGRRIVHPWNKCTSPVNDQAFGIGHKIVAGTDRDCLHAIDLFFGSGAANLPEVLITDTGSYSDLVFGIAQLLGVDYRPALAGLPDH